MEKVGIRKNVLLGCAYLSWLFALIVFILEKNEFTQEEQKKLIGPIIYLVLTTICGCIPILGWLAAVVLAVLYIITIIKYFIGDINYNMPIVYNIACWFIKDGQPTA